MPIRGGQDVVAVTCSNPDCESPVEFKINWWIDPGSGYGLPENYQPPDSGWNYAGNPTFMCPECGMVVSHDVVTETIEKWFSEMPW